MKINWEDVLTTAPGISKGLLRASGLIISVVTIVSDLVLFVNSRTTLQRRTVLLKQHGEIVTCIIFNTSGTLKVLK